MGNGNKGGADTFNDGASNWQYYHRISLLFLPNRGMEEIQTTPQQGRKEAEEYPAPGPYKGKVELVRYNNRAEDR